MSRTFSSAFLFMEAIICATSVPQGTGSGCIALHDFQTGSSLATFKQTNAAEHCTSILQSRNGQGGFMLSAQPDKSILNVYNFQKVRSPYVSLHRKTLIGLRRIN